MIRQYRVSDRDAVQAICAATALYGRPIAACIPDAAFAADALTRYYTEFEPESLLVAEERGAVTGYLAGCLDTRRCARLTVWGVVPRVAAAFVLRGHVFRAGWWRIAAALLAAGPARVRAMRGVSAAFPAHCHINVAEGARGAGAGTALWEAFRVRLESCRAPGVHVSTPTAAGKAFFARAGFELLSRYPAVPLGGVSPGDVWIMGLKLAA